MSVLSFNSSEQSASFITLLPNLVYAEMIVFVGYFITVDWNQSFSCNISVVNCHLKICMIWVVGKCWVLYTEIMLTPLFSCIMKLLRSYVANMEGIIMALGKHLRVRVLLVEFLVVRHILYIVIEVVFFSFLLLYWLLILVTWLVVAGLYGLLFKIDYCVCKYT